MKIGKLTIVAGLAVLAAAGALVWSFFLKPAGLDEEGPISFVYLLRQPRTVRLSEIKVAAERALGAKFGEADGSSLIRPTDPPGSFVIETERLKLLVLNVPQPYGQARVVRSGMHAEQAFQQHRAWLSVDWLEEPQVPTNDALRAMGKLAAELAGDDCLALYCPRSRQMITYGNDLLPALRSERPMNAFLVERK